MPARNRPVWRKALWISIPIIVMLAGATIYARNVPSTIGQDVAAVRALGYPTTWPEMDAIEEKEGANADPFYEQYDRAYWKLNQTNRDNLNSFLDDAKQGTVTPTERARAVNDYRFLLQPLIAGAKQPRWRSVSPPYDDIAVYEYRIYGGGFRLLVQSALYDAADKDSEKALAEMQAAKGIVAQRYRQRSLFDATEGDIHWCMAARDLVREDSALAKQLAQMASAPQVDIKHIFAADFIHWSETMEGPPRYGEDETLWEKIKDRFYYRAKMQRIDNELIHTYRAVFEKLPKDSNDPAQLRDIWQAEFDKVPTNRDEITRLIVDAFRSSWVRNCDEVLDMQLRHEALSAELEKLGA